MGDRYLVLTVDGKVAMVCWQIVPVGTLLHVVEVIVIRDVGSVVARVKHGVVVCSTYLFAHTGG